MRRMAHRYCWRVCALFLLLIPLALVSANGQSRREMRIGLQRQQAQVILCGTEPLTVTGADASAITIPAGETVTFVPALTHIGVTDHAGKTSVVAAPVRIATAGDDGFIHLLGPTRHYDARPDRPYRGAFEILAREDGLTVVNIVHVESYLLGVVSSEMRPSYPNEALKAQAVAARTYALKNLNRHSELGYDLDDTAHCQVYGGVLNEDQRTTRAISETAGMVLTHDGKMIDAVYSSTCGGFTESSEHAWGKAVPYLTGIADNHGLTRPTTEKEWAAFFKSSPRTHCLQPQHANYEAYRWIKLITRGELEAMLPEPYRVGTITAITPLQRGDSGRIYAVRLDGTERSVTIEKELPIRKAFGNVRSSAFTVETYRDDTGTPVVFAFWGAGWGHGLGMCQVGAVGLAEEGWSYERILQHYYRGALVQRL